MPTYKAATSELKQLGESLSGEQGHVFQLISDWDDPAEEFSILRQTSQKTGAKGTFTLIVFDATKTGVGNAPGFWKEQLKRIDDAQCEGLDIRGQVISRPIGVLMGHPASMSPFYQRPTFLRLQNLPWDERIKQLNDSSIKAKILAEKNENPHIFVQLLGDKFDMMYPMEDPIEYLPAPESSVAARAEREGIDPAEWLYDFLLGNNGHKLIYIPAVNFAEDAIPQLLGHEHTVAALGDGGAHVGSICDTSANIYLLTKWVREKKVFNLAQGINMLTRQPAELYSLYDRGLLAPGLKADINVIDFDALQLHTPHIVHDLPAGGMRFLQKADGILATIVSGDIIYRGGEATGALPGKLIRGQKSDPRLSQ